jgi:cytochrome b6-f complex iron-sulfur subunit
MGDDKLLSQTSRAAVGPDLRGGCSRRQLVRGAAFAACAPVLGRALAGCARRVSPNRDLAVDPPVDGLLIVPRASVAELDRTGGAVILHTSCVGEASVLLVNTGSGFLAMEAVCPHASCEIAWVPEDREAECPCHGSRFAGDGTVLNGPANRNLATYPANESAAKDSIEIHLFAGDSVFPAVSNGKLVFDINDHPALQSLGGVVIGHPDGYNVSIAVTRPSLTEPPLAVSALCTHLACTVQPNGTGASRTLHCPCHFSEFDLRGAYLSGPAPNPLPTFPRQFDSASGIITITLGPTC